MKYDDASWHRGEDFPADLAPEAAATHAAMFLGWALLAGLGGDRHVIESAGDFGRLRARKLTPGEYFLAVCNGEFTDEDLNPEGNAFAVAYYHQEGATFFADYREYLAKGMPSEYHVADSWANFDKLRPVLDRRLANWRRGRPADAPRNVKVADSSELPQDIAERIGTDFGSAEAPGILSRLAGFIGQFADRFSDAPDARTLRCVVHLAAGERGKLEDACRLALTDRRDVIRRAEYDSRDRRVRDYSRPFGS
jgi:hypothetical protein